MNGIDEVGSDLSLVRARSLRDQVLRKLEAALVAGELRPGEIYSAPGLARRFGVSATPVREAMLDLVQQGFVVPVRNRGFKVVELSETDLDQICQIRMLLEVSTIAQIAEALTPELVVGLDHDAVAAADAARRGELLEYLDADRKFHVALIATLNNPRLTELVDLFRRQSRLFGLHDVALLGRLDESADEHRQLLALVADGNITRAEALLTEHIVHTRALWASQDALAVQRRQP